MTLGREYLEYKLRREGLDHSWFAHSSMPRRTPLRWPGNQRIALWVVVHLEFFPISMGQQPVRPIGAMDRTYPDFWSFTHRDYGNRIGVYRIMRILDRLGIRATAAMNSRVAQRYPELLADMQRRNWEIAASGTDMAHLIHGGLSREEELGIIQDSVRTLRKLSGQPVSGWYSPMRSQSANTFDLLAQEQVSYVCDWINDDLPYAMNTPAGPLYAMPLTHDRSDAIMLGQYQQSIEDYEAQQLAAFRVFDREAQSQGGRVFSLSLSPWITGQPHRVAGLERMLTAIIQAKPWVVVGSELLESFRAQQ